MALNVENCATLIEVFDMPALVAFYREPAIPESAARLRDRLIGLREARRSRQSTRRSAPRRRQLLAPATRLAVLCRTDGRCHICGGTVISGRPITFWRIREVEAILSRTTWPHMRCAMATDGTAIRRHSNGFLRSASGSDCKWRREGSLVTPCCQLLWLMRSHALAGGAAHRASRPPNKRVQRTRHPLGGNRGTRP